MEESRTKKVTRNTFFSILYKLSDVILAFVLRTIFIHTLGKSYLGISGLFTNVLTVLSVMELGVGGAIVFSLYQPLAEKNYNKVAALMQLYKKVYAAIGIVVIALGIALTPFLKYIIKLPSDINYIYVIYWLSIANTGVSYFLAYRRTLLVADQRSDLDLKNQIIFRCTRFFVLSISLLIFNSYILYLILDVLNTFVSNIQITYVVKKKYAYIDNRNINSLTKEEKQNILKYMRSGLFTKFGQTVINSTDNIIISAFVSTLYVGIYSNYLMIVSSLDVAFYLMFSGITASIGNYALENSGKQVEKLFRNITWINYVASAYITICLASLINPFIHLWAGKDYLLSIPTVVIIILNFYLATMQKSIECFMGARGDLFYKNRFRSAIEGLINLVVSLVLVKYTGLGITGVFLGTTVCFVVGRVWMDAYILYKYWFDLRFSKYLMQYIIKISIVFIISIVGFFLTNELINFWGLSIFSWCFAGIVLTILTFLFIWIIYRKSDEYKFFIEIIRKKLLKK